MKNKKTKYILSIAGFLTVLFTVMSLSTGCASTQSSNPYKLKDEHIVAPNPNNPYDGTWIDRGPKNTMYVIKNNEATYYRLPGYMFGANWEKSFVIKINENTCILSDNNNTLSMGGLLFERLIKEE